MKREMTSLQVYANENEQIVIRQDRSDADDTFVYFPPAQAQLLIKWIEEVAIEIAEDSDTDQPIGADGDTGS